MKEVKFGKTGKPILNLDYTEILKLHQLLEEEGIPHTLKRFLDGWQICYPAERHGDGRIMDAIEHAGSYGNEDDLLEIMGLLTPEEEEHDSVVGYLSAEEVFLRMKVHKNKDGAE